ITVFHFMA
ncbi:3-isopropylmalate dehydrogenase, partial [Haemophilus influenzae]